MSSLVGHRFLAFTIVWFATSVMFTESSRSNESTETRPNTPKRARYRIDADKSQFIVETQTTGLSSMFGHDHKIAVRNFGGMASFIPGAPETASLTVTVRADSLRLLDEDIKAKDRRNIETTIRTMLGSATYGNITFESTAVTIDMIGDGVFNVEIQGDLRLHGVWRPVTVPVQLILRPDSLRVTGTLGLRQTDYKITPASFAGGTVKVRDEVTLTFSLVATRLDQM